MQIRRLWPIICLFGLFWPIQAQTTEGNAADAFYLLLEAPGPANTDIYLLSPDGQTLTNLTESQARDYHPSWSPDGRQLVFTSDRDGNNELYIMNANGDELRNLTNSAQSSDVAPDWSPLHDEIVFVSDRNGGFDLYVFDRASNAIRRLTTDEQPKSAPAWSPDGGSIAYWQQTEGEFHLRVVDAITSTTRTLVGAGANNWPAWSPDGQQIVYFAVEGQTTDIFLVDVQTGATQNLTNTPHVNELRPAWSPDGETIYFASDVGASAFSLYRMAADGSAPQPVLRTLPDANSVDVQPTPYEINMGDSAALGQNVNRVIGDIPPDAIEQFGVGEQRLFAPQRASQDDLIRVRLEIEAQAYLPGFEPAATAPPTPALPGLPIPMPMPLRDQRLAALYTYMGAELAGIDLERFRVSPQPTAYVQRLRTSGVNYWEWYLRPREDARGRNFLSVILYVPPRPDAAGVPVQQELSVVPFEIEILSDAAVQSSYIVEPDVEEPLGFSVYYDGDDNLTIGFRDELDISEMTIADDQLEYYVLEDFPSAQAQRGVCLRYMQEEDDSTYPRACRTRQELPLSPADVFWYDLARNTPLDTIIRFRNRVFVCPAAEIRCDF